MTSENKRTISAVDIPKQLYLNDEGRRHFDSLREYVLKHGGSDKGYPELVSAMADFCAFHAWNSGGVDFFDLVNYAKRPAQI